MAVHCVVRSKRQRCPKNSEHFHVSAIGTAEGAFSFRLWTFHDVTDALGKGDHFYIEIADRGTSAEVVHMPCPGCMEVATLASTATLPTGEDAIVGLPELH